MADAGSTNREQIQELLAQSLDSLSQYPTEALRLARAARVEAERAKEPDALSDCLFHAAQAQMALLMGKEALQSFEQAASHARQANDDMRLCSCLNGMGMAYARLRVHSRALELFLDALDLARRASLDELECHLLNNVAAIFSELRDMAGAEEYLHLALNKAASVGLPLAVFYRNLGNHYFETKDLAMCRRYLGHGLRHAAKDNDRSSWGDLQHVCGMLRAMNGRHRAALAYFGKALSQAREACDYMTVVELETASARSLVELNRLDEADRMLTGAYDSCSRHGLHDLMREVLDLRIAVAEQQGDLNRSLQFHREFRKCLAEREEEEASRKRSYLRMQISLHQIRKAHERLKEDVRTDALTGCSSYRGFEERSREVLDGGVTHAALIFIDVDYLKLVNDSFGHHAGDSLLISMADEMRKALVGDGFVTRKSGDEFIVFLPDAGRADVENYLSRLFEGISKPHDLGGIRIPMSLSAGVAMYPENAESIRNLERLADSAMYQAKGMGRRRYCYSSGGEPPYCVDLGGFGDSSESSDAASDAKRIASEC